MLTHQIEIHSVPWMNQISWEHREDSETYIHKDLPPLNTLPHGRPFPLVEHVLDVHLATKPWRGVTLASGFCV